MEKALLETKGKVGMYMENIQALFKPGSKITVIVRPPPYRVEGDTDFLMTDDNLDKVIALLERSKKREGR